MLHRSTSSRRRRASRSSTSSPQTRLPRTGSTPVTGRRASIAVSAVSLVIEPPSITTSSPERSRCSSPEKDGIEVPESALSPRKSMTDFDRKQANTLLSSDRSSRYNLAPTDPPYNRGSRTGLPDISLSPRNSLIPDNFNRSQRNSIASETPNRSARNSLVPDVGRSPRHSLVPGDLSSSHRSLTLEFNNTLAPEPSRSPRHSLVPVDSESGGMSRSPINRSLRSCNLPDPILSRTNQHGVIGDQDEERSPRGSVTLESGFLGPSRSPRGSIARSEIGYNDRSPRGSLTFSFQEPLDSRSRRASADSSQTSKCPNVIENSMLMLPFILFKLGVG